MPLLPEKCTGAYVGKKVSAEGTTVIARSEDQRVSVYNKLFFVEKRKSAPARFLSDTGKGQCGRYPIPNDTLKYTYLLDGNSIGDGPYPACCMNEQGLTVIGTVTTFVSDEYAAIDPLVEDGTGIREAVIPSLIACRASTASEGVRVLAAYLDEFGSGEYNTVLLSDREEAWIFEIYGGHSYAAQRMPEDKMALFGNQIMLGWTDLTAGNDRFFSANLPTCLSRLSAPVRDERGRIHLARSINPPPRLGYSNLRNWIGLRRFAAAFDEAYSDDTFYPLFFTPEKKVSVTDLMTVFGDRYENTPFDMALPQNAACRPIGVSRQTDVHIVQTFSDLPGRCCALQWLAMSSAEHAIFIPAFSGITETYEKFRVDHPSPGKFGDGFYDLCKTINSIASTDRAFLSRGVREFNLSEEKKMLKEMLAAKDGIREAYRISDEKGDAFVTSLAESTAKEQYEKARDLLARLCYTQANNLNDYPAGENKTPFAMPGFAAEDKQTSSSPATNPMIL